MWKSLPVKKTFLAQQVTTGPVTGLGPPRATVALRRNGSCGQDDWVSTNRLLGFAVMGPPK